MSIINFCKQQSAQEKVIEKRIRRNRVVLDEVHSLGADITLSKGILIDNFIFDFLALADESNKLKKVCVEYGGDFGDIKLMVYEGCLESLTREGFTSEELFEMTLTTMSSKVNTRDKRLILFKIEEKYPMIYKVLRDDAEELTHILLRRIILL